MVIYNAQNNSYYRQFQFFHHNYFLLQLRIVGQGKEVLNMSKLLNLKNIDLDKIFHEFAKYEDPKTNLVDLRAIFQRNRLQYDVVAKLFFQVLDKSKSEHLDFLQFLVTFWAFLSADENGLASFVFSQFDSERLLKTNFYYTPILTTRLI